MAEHPNDLAAIASTSKAPTQPVPLTRPISLADSAKRSRMTPAAKKREEMTEKMYKLIEKEVKKDVEEVEDEYEFAFISLAKRANKYLTNDQKEDLLQDVEEAVCQAINKARRIQYVEIKDHSLQQLLLLLLLKQIMFHNLHHLWSMLQLCNRL